MLQCSDHGCDGALNLTEKYPLALKSRKKVDCIKCEKCGALHSPEGHIAVAANRNRFYVGDGYIKEVNQEGDLIRNIHID